jgi:hypothetical protein
MARKRAGKSYPSKQFQQSTLSHNLMSLIYLLTYRTTSANNNFSHTTRPKTTQHPLTATAHANDKKRGGGDCFFFFFLPFR